MPSTSFGSPDGRVVVDTQKRQVRRANEPDAAQKQEVTAAHYLQVTELHSAKAVQNPVQYPAASSCGDSQEESEGNAEPAICGPMRKETALCSNTGPFHAPRAGLEPGEARCCRAEHLGDSAKSGGAVSGADSPKTGSIEPDLQRVIDAWAELPQVVKAGVLAMVEAAKKPE